MKFADVVGFSKIELMKKKKELVGQLFESRMKNSLGQLANPMSIRHLRRDIARLNTALFGGGTKAKAEVVESSAGLKKTKSKAKKGS